MEMESKPTPTGKTRRTHTKSRGGCAECKRRKLKCDEAKPVCSGCTKREITCVYLSKVGSRTPLSKDAGHELRPNTSVSTTIPDNGPIASHAAAGPSRPPGIVAANERRGSTVPVRGIGEFNMEDMALWHQFIYTTAATLSNPWGHELPALALNCDYLMHGILSLGALHLAYLWCLDPAKREHYSYLADHHYDLAIRPFQRAMKNPTPENANQRFAFSTLLIVVNYASNRSPNTIFPFGNGGAYEGVSSWLACLRGCAGIFESAREHIEQGPLGFLITQGTRMQEILSTGAQPTPEDEASLARTENVVLHLPSVETTTTIDEMKAYSDAITRLRALLAASTQPLDSVIKRAVCSIWPSRVSSTFVRLLSEKRPPALIITAHYCLLFRGLDDCWYMQHRGLDLFQVVERTLGDEWASYLEHPRREFCPNPKSFDERVGR